MPSPVSMGQTRPYLGEQERRGHRPQEAERTTVSRKRTARTVVKSLRLRGNGQNRSHQPEVWRCRPATQVLLPLLELQWVQSRWHNPQVRWFIWTPICLFDGCQCHRTSETTVPGLFNLASFQIHHTLLAKKTTHMSVGRSKSKIILKISEDLHPTL